MTREQLGLAVNEALQKRTGNNYSYVSDVQLLALLDVMATPTKEEYVPPAEPQEVIVTTPPANATFPTETTAAIETKES